MILASSSFSSHSNRTPLTVPWVPTGIKTGVSITERLVVRKPVRALPSRAVTCQSIGFSILMVVECRGPIGAVSSEQRPYVLSSDRGLGDDGASLVHQN